jgi:hypothetical protein
MGPEPDHRAWRMGGGRGGEPVGAEAAGADLVT